jgi:hypothetical protein
MQLQSMKQEQFDSLHTPQAKLFFTVPLGLIFKVESLSSMGGNHAGGQEQKAFVEIVAKDGRKFHFTCKNY